MRVRGVLTLSGGGKGETASEDAVAVSRRGTRIALCDGASASFNAAGWARTLTAAVIGDAPFSGAREARAADLLASLERAREIHGGGTSAAGEGGRPAPPRPAAARSTTNHSGPSARRLASEPWYARAARASGDYATLLYVQARLGVIEFASIGDTILLAAGERGAFCWPDPLEYDFAAPPELVHSREATPEFPDVAAAWRRVRLRDLGRRAVVILASDAVAPVVAAAARTRALFDAALELADLATLDSDTALRAVVERRAAGAFRDDDTTVVVMR